MIKNLKYGKGIVSATNGPLLTFIVVVFTGSLTYQLQLTSPSFRVLMLKRGSWRNEGFFASQSQKKRKMDMKKRVSLELRHRSPAEVRVPGFCPLDCGVNSTGSGGRWWRSTWQLDLQTAKLQARLFITRIESYSRIKVKYGIFRANDDLCRPLSRSNAGINLVQAQLKLAFISDYQ